MQQWNLPMLQKKLIGVLLHPISWQYPTQTARENSRDDYGDFTSTPQSTWIIKNSTESTVMSVTISGEECLGINQTASNAIWRIDGVAQSGRTGTVDCDNELHNIQFNGG